MKSEMDFRQEFEEQWNKYQENARNISQYYDFGKNRSR